MKAKRVVLGLGSNIDPIGNLGLATELCSQIADSRLVSQSFWYWSPPWGGATGGGYVNGALLLETLQTPWALLAATQSIEKRMGRLRGPRYAPRTIDIDMLCFAGARLELPWLSLPHPQLLQRRFALRPLCDIAAHTVISNGVSARLALLRCPDKSTLYLMPDRLPTF